MSSCSESRPRGARRSTSGLLTMQQELVKDGHSCVQEVMWLGGKANGRERSKCSEIDGVEATRCAATWMTHAPAVASQGTRAAASGIPLSSAFDWHLFGLGGTKGEPKLRGEGNAVQ